ncbi:MAG: hypothetical protein LBC68_12370, partial [Prevotellaceae bacterium]|nr:hypothetical protein [Prevotellaceae bacterium]
MKNKLLLSLLLCLFFTGIVRAGIRTVTKTDGGNTEAGSLAYELKNFEDGDTILFADELKGETIQITVNLQSDVVTGNNGTKGLTIIGNGVTITTTNKTIQLGGSNAARAFKSLRVENMIFKDFGMLVFYSFVSPSVISNCTFISTDNTANDHIIQAENGHSIFE